jgi:hypothetical protein
MTIIKVYICDECGDNIVHPQRRTWISANSEIGFIGRTLISPKEELHFCNLKCLVHYLEDLADTLIEKYETRGTK